MKYPNKDYIEHLRRKYPPGARRRRVCKRFAAVGERLGRTGVLRALRKTHVELFLVCADLKIYRTILGLDALGFRSGFTTLLLHSVDKFCRAGVHNSQLQLIDNAVGLGGIIL